MAIHGLKPNKGHNKPHQDAVWDDPVWLRIIKVHGIERVFVYGEDDWYPSSRTVEEVKRKLGD